MVLYASVPSLIVRNTNTTKYRHKQVFLPEAICCCLQTCKCGFGIVYQCTKSHSQEQVFLPEAICCCLHVVLTLEWYCVLVY